MGYRLIVFGKDWTTEGLALYSTSGKELIPPKYLGINDMGNGLFSLAKKDDFSESDIYDAKTNKYYLDYRFTDDMYRVNLEKNGELYFGYIDGKTGRVVLSENEQFKFEGSEGVIGAYDKINRCSGYIYNPVGPREFVYN